MIIILFIEEEFRRGRSKCILYIIVTSEKQIFRSIVAVWGYAHA